MVDLSKSVPFHVTVPEWILTERRGAHGLHDWWLQANSLNDLADWFYTVTR